MSNIVQADRLVSNQSIGKGGRITSANKQYFLALQTDGNLVLYNAQNQAIWSPNIAGKGAVKAVMQTDGNFVVYDSQNRPLFNTGTAGHPGAFIVVQNDGNIVVYQGTTALWDSRTAGGHYHPASSGGFLNVVANTLGGAAKGLANGVAVAAKFSGKAFTDVTSSPLWKIAAGVAPFVLPGIGIAVSAGMVTAAAIGKAGSVKDAIIGAARENLPGGDAAKAGFDVATGIAIHGEGMTEAALNAVRNQVPNGAAKAGFDAALSLHVGRATAKTAAPANLSPQAKAAFYTTKGLVKANAPPATKKAVAEMVVTNLDSHRGLQAAVASEVGANMSWLQWAWHEMKTLGTKVHSNLFHKSNVKNVITVKGEVVYEGP